jgi:6-phosphogluconolactonase (cycloisomerase 2 family)
MPHSKKHKKKVDKVCYLVKQRLKNEIEQSGGLGPREINFSSNGDIGNLINQMSNLMVNTIAGVVDSVNLVANVAMIPSDFSSITGKNNEPLPGNLGVTKFINVL